MNQLLKRIDEEKILFFDTETVRKNKELDIISIINTHFAENIKESIEYLTHCLNYDFTKKSIFEFKKDSKTIYIVKNPV